MAIAWVHPSQATEESDAWLDHVVTGTELVVPAIWPLEVCNALLVLQRRRKLTAAERASALGKRVHYVGHVSTGETERRRTLFR